MREQLLKYLKNKQPSTRIAVFTLGSKLNLIQGFTGDSGLLQAALKDKHFGFSPVTAEPSRSRSDDDADKEEVAIKAEAFGGPRGMGTAGVAALQQSQAEYAGYQGDQRVAMTLDALQHLGRFLAGIPGRKNLIWFASSYPIYFFPKSTEKQPLNNHGEYAKQIKATSDLLTLSKVAVYPIDAEGMMNDHPMDSEHDLGAAGMGGGLVHNTMEGAAGRSETISTMQQLAADTGGQAIFNANDLDGALNRAIHNGDHYYTLVYTPANKQMDGNFRSIQIKLGDSKDQLSYRRGYYADDNSAPSLISAKPQKTIVSASGSNQEPAQHSDPLTPLLTRGMPAATQILYAVRVQSADPQPALTAKHLGANTKLTGAFTRYTADFLIDPKKIQLDLTPEGNRTGKIQVGLLAWDHEGKALNWVGGTMVLDLNSTAYAEIQKTGIRAHAELDVPLTNVYLSTGVYDLTANKAGTLEIPLAPAAPAAALSSPSGK
jgi:VWFA-related protein